MLGLVRNFVVELSERGLSQEIPNSLQTACRSQCQSAFAFQRICSRRLLIQSCFLDLIVIEKQAVKTVNLAISLI
jgi:hypothetical protein